MTVVIIDGRIRASWLTALSNINSPTVTELNAGIALEGEITPDGLNISAKTGAVDTSNLGSTFNSMRAGRRSFDLSIKFHHSAGTDLAFNLFPYRTNGFLVVRRGIDKTTGWISGQVVAVYPLEAGEPDEEQPKPDGTWDFTSPFFLTADPQTRAIVA